MAIQDTQGNLIGAPQLGEYTYEMDYYSGSQINLLMGDVLIDSAVKIGFDVNQSKTPVFGYANQYYSFLADGHILVQGSLIVAFKETGYLLWPIQRYQEKIALIAANPTENYTGTSNLDAWTSPRYKVEDGKVVNSYKPSNFSFLEASKAGENRKNMRANVEQMVALTNNPDKNNPDVFRQYNQFVQGLGSLPDEDFEKWAEQFEDVLWYGSDPANPATRDKLYSKNLLAGNEITDEDVYSHRRIDQYPPIDIWITYGDFNAQTPNHSVVKLLDVSFVGQSQTIEISGEPIYQVVSFLARNMV
jgi:hypothetical protein